MLIVATSSLVALLQAAFLVLEMFLWQTPFGRKTFRMSADKAELTSVLAKNQGLYNGFLSAGIVWALFEPDASVATPLLRFMLGCVLVAGLYGAATASRAILFIQALPAAIALAATWLTAR